MNLSLSGFSLNTEFIPAHELKIKEVERYAGKRKDNFLNFFVYCDDYKKEILQVGCNKGGIVSFIQSQVSVSSNELEAREELEVREKLFLSKALDLGLKRLPASFVANLNDLHLDMNFVSWDGVIDPETGNIVIVGSCHLAEAPFWTQILISPLMLDYSKANLPVSERFSLLDLKNLYTIINKK